MSKISTEQQKALVLLTRAMLDQVDEIAAIKSQGGSALISSGMLREMSGVLKEIDSSLLDAYLEMLPALTSHSLPARGVKIDDETAKFLNQPRRGFVTQMRADLGVKIA